MVRVAMLFSALFAFSASAFAEQPDSVAGEPVTSQQVQAPVVAQPAAPAGGEPAPAQQSPAQPAATAPQAAGATNAITRAAVAQGVLSCAARINQVTNYVGYNDRSGALVMTTPGQQMDQRLLPVIMEIQTGSGVAYASATFAPNQANGCGATYDAVAYWPLKCDQVATKQFSSFKKVGTLRKDLTVLDGGVATKVLLMTAGAGCVSVKKELVL